MSRIESLIRAWFTGWLNSRLPTGLQLSFSLSRSREWVEWNGTDNGQITSVVLATISKKACQAASVSELPINKLVEPVEKISRVRQKNRFQLISIKVTNLSDLCKTRFDFIFFQSLWICLIKVRKGLWTGMRVESFQFTRKLLGCTSRRPGGQDSGSKTAITEVWETSINSTLTFN